MKPEEKQALIERLNKLAESLKWHNVRYAQDVLAALAALNAPPVKLPQIIQIGYTQDEITCMCNIRNDDIAAIRAAGYEVLE